MDSRDSGDSIVTVLCLGCRRTEIEIFVRRDTKRRDRLTYDIFTPSAFADVVPNGDFIEFMGVCETCAGGLAHKSEAEGAAILCTSCRDRFLFVLYDFETYEYAAWGGVISGISLNDDGSLEPLFPHCNQCVCLHSVPQMSAP